MAATMLKHNSPDVEVFAAGTIVPPEREGKEVSQISQKGSSVMFEIGLDMTKNIVKGLTPQMIEDADRVIVMGPTSSPLPEYLYNSSKLEKWDVPDPGSGDITHANARDIIQLKIKDLIKELD